LKFYVNEAYDAEMEARLRRSKMPRDRLETEMFEIETTTLCVGTDDLE